MGREFGPDPDRDAAQAVDRREARLVGHVVAGEHRAAAAKRRLLHEGGDRPALVAAGRLQLEHLLALEQHQRAAACRRHRQRQRLGLLLDLGGLAVVQRQRQALVLEQHARMLAREALQPGARRREGGRIGLAAHHAACKVAALQAVQPRGAQAQRREQFVELLERAAADQCQRAAAGLLQVGEDAGQPLRHAYRARLALDLDQRAVDVEKQRDLVDAKVRRRWRRGRHRLGQLLAVVVAGRRIGIALPAPTKSCNRPNAGYIWRRWRRIGRARQSCRPSRRPADVAWRQPAQTSGWDEQRLCDAPRARSGRPSRRRRALPPAGRDQQRRRPRDARFGELRRPAHPAGQVSVRLRASAARRRAAAGCRARPSRRPDPPAGDVSPARQSRDRGCERLAGGRGDARATTLPSGSACRRRRARRGRWRMASC